MMIKRKRSDSENSTTNLSSPLRPSFQNGSVSPFTRDLASSHLSSRTRKRHRDNRPDENQIHEHTMSLLYAAQRHPSGPIPAQSPPPAHAVPYAPHVHQASLHSFWALPSKVGFSPNNSNFASNSRTTSSSPAMLTAATHCEDCQAALVQGDGDVDMDVDVDVDVGVADLACTACGKVVCHRCAVSNLGEQRRCLICAGKRHWVGGLGWVDN